MIKNAICGVRLSFLALFVLLFSSLGPGIQNALT